MGHIYSSLGSSLLLSENFGGCGRDLEMSLQGLIDLSSEHPKGRGVDVQSVLLTMMTTAGRPQEGRRGHLSPSTLVS